MLEIHRSHVAYFLAYWSGSCCADSGC